MRRREQLSYPVKWRLSGGIQGPLALEALEAYCCHAIDFLLVNRNQTSPFHDVQHFLQRLDDGERRDGENLTELPSRRAGFHRRRCQVAANRIRLALDACENMMSALTEVFRSYMEGHVLLKEVVLIVGPVLMSPREVYRFLVPPRSNLREGECEEIADAQLGVLQRKYLMQLAASELYDALFRTRPRPTQTRLCVVTSSCDTLESPWTIMPAIKCGKKVKELTFDLAVADRVEHNPAESCAFGVTNVEVCPFVDSGARTEEVRWFCIQKALKGALLPNTP